jgi:7-cyano-7-deazaguanine synthase
MPQAYVSLSGGVDSTATLAIANRDWNGRVCAVSFNYGQRHQIELERAKQIAKHYDNQHIILDVRSIIQKGGLTDENLDIPPVSYEDLPHGVSPTYVPFRNGTFISLLAGLASVDDEAQAIYVGVHAEDGENWAYPDCTPEFVGSMASAVFIGTYHKVRVHAPLVHMRKYEAIEYANNLKGNGRQALRNVPWGLTWSCYEGREIHCGVCPTCRARKEAFGKATAMVDITEYENE